VGKVTLQVIFNEDPFLNFIFIYTERNLRYVGWHNECWPRKVCRQWM